MRILGLEIRKAVPITKALPRAPINDSRGGWTPWIHEPYSGAWQKNDSWTTDTVMAHHAVFACVTLIANDFGKLRNKLVQQDSGDIWEEVRSAAFSPVLRRPNRYQNHIQFKECYVTSKMMHGNVYGLLVRDARRVVTSVYLLNPSRVKILVAPDGSVFYALGQDNLSGIQDTDTVVPASEIAHDRINCLFHPLVGVSPIFACGLAANIGLNIERNSSGFFLNGSNPSGVLTGPLPIDQATADRLSAQWNALYSGDRSGKVAVVGSGLAYQALRMTAVESQLIEQLKWTADVVCSVFHVPPFKLGIGPMPTYQNAELLNQIYYSDCLQSLIEQYELVMDEALGLAAPKDGKMMGVELDLDGLLRMDSATQVTTLAAAVGGTIMAPNEARKKLDMKPKPGGDAVLSQQQNYSLEALAERDANKPFSKPVPAVPALAPAADDSEEEEEDKQFWEVEKMGVDRQAMDCLLTKVAA